MGLPKNTQNCLDKTKVDLYLSCEDENRLKEAFMNQTLLTAKELSARIKFSANYINAELRDSIFIEGKHYIRPFNGRKILYIWEEVEAYLYEYSPMTPQATRSPPPPSFLGVSE
jgi:hypothetical protein